VVATATNEYVGEVWVVAAAGSIQDIPVTVNGTNSQLYSFEVKPEDIKLNIYSGTSDITDQTNAVVVGQTISLRCALSVTNMTPTNYQWTIPGYAISNYVADVNSGTVYSNFSTINSNVDFYWVDGATNRQVQCSIMVNGQNLSAKAVFNIQRPNVEMTAEATGAITADTNYIYNAKFGTSFTFLHFGGAQIGTNSIPGVKFQLLSTDVAEQPVFFIQTGNSSEADKATNGVTYVGIGSGVDNGNDTNDYIYPLDAAYEGSVTVDSPGSSLSSGFTNVSISDSFTMYLMFQSTNVGAIAVPIKRMDWAWSATAVLTNAALNLWNVIPSAPPPNLVQLNSTSYPTWTNHMQPITWTPPL